LTRAEAERRGRNGEGWAALWLRVHGWRVIARRVRTPRGEIDLIARRGRQVAFVEVKWRADAAGLAQSIDEYRLRRVAAAVEATAHRYAGAGDTLRIDVLLLAPWRWPRHIVNAWQP
jgi:putative endonuclease